MTDSKNGPKHLEVRMYQVGFGDCFLLSFKYASPSKDRHILIDFGTTAQPDQLMVDIANDIKHVTNGKLHAVVATHRHRDHISGFATKPNGSGSGDIIASLKPNLVVQPWTEDPKLPTDAKAPTGAAADRKAFFQGMANMNRFAEVVHRFATTVGTQRKLNGKRQTPTLNQLSFLGENNLANLSAVKNLQSMSPKSEYLYYGCKTKLSSILPGVKVRVLGPPTLKQTSKISKQRPRDAGEFWHFQAAASERYAVAQKHAFPKASTGNIPASARWVTQRVDRIALQQMLAIVRVLDDAMNNTSIILLFEVAGKKLLFPGDAQIENWSYALFDADDHQANQELLSDVELYKVGHHGSLNATPKTLWNLFKHRSNKPGAHRLETLMSTQFGVHGHSTSSTEVPRTKLVDALNHESDLVSTDTKRKVRLKFRAPDLLVVDF